MRRIKAYLNNFFWLFLTYFAAPYLYFRILFRPSANEVKKILVIQFTKIGDLVCTTPVFREIREKFPSAYLAVLVRSDTKDILKNNSRINEIISINDYQGIKGRFKLIKKLGREKYDWAFNFSPIDILANIIAFWALIPNRVTTVYKGAGEMVRVLSVFNNHRLEFKQHTSLLKHYLTLLKFLGIEARSEKKEVFIKPEEEKKALDFLRRNNLSREDFLVGISCTSGIPFRQWELEKFAALADLLTERLKAKIFFIGTAGDFSKNEKVQKIMRQSSINAAGAFKLYELSAFLKNLKLFISMDTGPIYIANAMHVPVVDIAASDDMAEQSPSGPNVIIIQKDLYCAPCLCVFSGIRYCKEGHLRCIKEITPEEVFRACQELLKNYK